MTPLEELPGAPMPDVTNGGRVHSVSFCKLDLRDDTLRRSDEEDLILGENAVDARFAPSLHPRPADIQHVFGMSIPPKVSRVYAMPVGARVADFRAFRAETVMSLARDDVDLEYSTLSPDNPVPLVECKRPQDALIGRSVEVVVQEGLSLATRSPKDATLQGVSMSLPSVVVHTAPGSPVGVSFAAVNRACSFRHIRTSSSGQASGCLRSAGALALSLTGGCSS